jgi:uncharacterized protein YuzB (UPF0349 family)
LTLIGLGIVIVEVCDRNAFVLLQLEQLEERYPEVSVVLTNCVNMCNLCRARPFALVNGHRVYAETPEQCMRKVEELIRRELEEFYR